MNNETAGRISAACGFLLEKAVGAEAPHGFFATCVCKTKVEKGGT